MSYSIEGLVDTFPRYKTRVSVTVYQDSTGDFVDYDYDATIDYNVMADYIQQNFRRLPFGFSSVLEIESWKEKISLTSNEVKLIMQFVCHFSLHDVIADIISDDRDWLVEYFYDAAEHECNNS